MNTQNEYKTILTINDPPQFGVIIEDENTIDNSIFNKIYHDAINNVTDIIHTNKKNLENKKSEEMINTTIAFVGQRGSGKSTALYSFANFLKNNSISKIASAKKYDILTNIKFQVLSPIDSAQLGVKETIIGRISAAMLSEYNRLIDNFGCNISAEKKREFIKKIKEVNEYAVMYQSGEWFKREESLLDDTYQISMLRKNMQELVHTYLRMISKNDNLEDSYLVISIDDLDMGIENSYSVMEEIRKFLCISNTIVLITLRMDQVYLSLKTKFKNQLNIKTVNDDDDLLIEDLAYRYAEKLFPNDRQHQMPVLSADQLNSWWADFKLGENKPSNSVCNEVLNLIWKKTRLILIKNKYDEHLLVPHNLRSLCNFVAFLRNLSDVEKEDETVNYDILSHNIDEFSQYWINNIRSFESDHISQEDQNLSNVLIKIIQNINSVPLKKINSYIIRNILVYIQDCSEKNYYRKIFDEKYEKSRYSEGEILLDSCMHPELISVGDLSFVLGKIDSKTECRYIKYLIEVIRTLWSAKMTDFYYEHIDEENSILFAEHSDYMITIGSFIINPDIGFFDKNTDFEYIDTKFDEKTMFFVYQPTEKSSEIFNDYSSWRENCFDKKATVSSAGWYHPFKIFTSLDFIKILPYYSFDFIYRLYEELHERQATSDSFYEKIQSALSFSHILRSSTVDLIYENSINDALENAKSSYDDKIKKILLEEAIKTELKSADVK